MPHNQEYLNTIASKLERLNMVQHGSKSPIIQSKIYNNSSIRDEMHSPDIMDWMGKASLDYINKQKNL